MKIHTKCPNFGKLDAPGDSGIPFCLSCGSGPGTCKNGILTLDITQQEFQDSAPCSQCYWNDDQRGCSCFWKNTNRPDLFRPANESGTTGVDAVKCKAE